MHNPNDIPSKDIVDPKSHFRSAMALCSSVFIMFYLSMSVFPYMGFMVLQLVPGLERESVGTRVGFLAGAFMVGRTLTAYGWGRLADRYGRKIVLIITLLVSAVGSLLFGCSSSYTMALIVRFFMGFGNGTMVVARTSISELAKGDKMLESKGMAILMSVSGYAMLICPAMGGFLAEPLQLYPNMQILHSPALEPLLASFPFLLPNLLAFVLSLLSMLLIIVYVEETLPAEQQRHWSHMGTDMVQFLLQQIPFFNESPPPEPSQAFDPEMAATETTPLTRASSPEKRQSVSIKSIMSKTETRAYLISAWCNHLASICQSEAFPLFAMSLVGGLGLDESMIATVGTLAGILYIMGQYPIFQCTMDRYGLVRATQYGSMWAVLPIALTPFSLLLPKGWTQIVFLSFMTATQTIARSIFFGGNTIGCNRSIDGNRRAAMNGVASTGVGLARGLGPMFVGSLMAFSLTSSAEWGAWMTYAVISMVGVVAYRSSLLIPLEEE